MKRITIAFILSIISSTIFPQAPQSFNYQVIVRATDGNVLPNQNIGIRVSILKGGDLGPAVYVETHTIVTDDLGLINLEIGNGTVVSGSIGNIQWHNDSYYLQIELDENGGFGFFTDPICIPTNKNKFTDI